VRTVLLAEVHVALRDRSGCAELLPLLEAYGDTVVVLWPGVVTLGPAALYRGSVLAVLGRTAAARTDLQRALALAEELGARPYADRARRRLAALPPG
jgi:predicted RNA polymerase sigma factor